MFFVETPSMGVTAPVGSLVVTKAQEEYKQDDVITFYRGVRVYTHRIVGEKDDKFITKGDLNQAVDASLVSRDDVIGQAVHIWKHLGWLWKALPWLIIGFIIIYLISSLKKIRDSWRWTVRIIGCSLVVIITTFVLNPWFNVQMLGFTSHEEGGINMHVVNTGMFAIRRDDGGRYRAGEDTVVHVTDIDNQGRYIYMPRPSIGWKGIVFAFFWSITPLLIGLTVRLPFDDEELEAIKKGDLTQEDIDREKHINLVVFVIFVLLSLVLIFSQLSTLAAFTAQTTNTTNTTKTRNFFDPLTALTHNSNQTKPLFIYTLGINQQEEPDVSANNPLNHGSYETGSTSIFNPSTTRNPVIDTTTYGAHRGVSEASTHFGAVVNGVKQEYCLLQKSGNSSINRPRQYSVETWFMVPAGSTNSGKLIGFSYSRDAISGNLNDRSLYIDDHGYLVFYTNPVLSKVAVHSQKPVNDGQWHHVVVTSGSGGLKMYLDGQLDPVHSIADATRGGGSYRGYWRLGCGRGNGHVNHNGSSLTVADYFTGHLHYAAVYKRELTAEQAYDHYWAGAP